MHISCYANPQTQESKKAAIVNMFKLMAASGKLVRVSELDMGYVDANGNPVKTGDMTEEQHKQMAEHYKFVVKAYLENIPANQQWGICQWCATDAPVDSGWRGGEPVGLWDKDYYRNAVNPLPPRVIFRTLHVKCRACEGPTPFVRNCRARESPTPLF